MIVEGKMQYLFDEKGRRYLDVSVCVCCMCVCTLLLFCT